MALLPYEGGNFAVMLLSQVNRQLCQGVLTALPYLRTILTLRRMFEAPSPFMDDIGQIRGLRLMIKASNRFDQQFGTSIHHSVRLLQTKSWRRQFRDSLGGGRHMLVLAMLNPPLEAH